MSVILRFVDTQSNWVSAIIRGAQFGVCYSHVEAVTKEGFYLGALMSGGVQLRPSTYDTTWTSELFVGVPTTDEQEAIFWDFLMSKIGLPYDHAAIIEMAAGVLTGEAQHWPTAQAFICSALQTAALLTAGIIKGAPATVRLAMPRDVLVACAALTPIGEPTPRSAVQQMA
jgi:hypothetical protein